MDSTVIKDLVLNVDKPVVLRNLQLPWKCFDVPFEEWLGYLDMEAGEITFEAGSKRHGSRPQWERTRSKVRMTMAEFFANATTGQGHFRDNWVSYSYRCVGELPEICRAGIDFSAFGFPEIREDVSFWIGSEGAHTPCHYDTYGCNIVVQVRGRKRWLLFPPEATLTPTRVPYEESSVYCEENFYSPEVYSRVIAVENDAYHVVLEPGMALMVPPKWWHFVENLEPSLNFNTWIQLETDTEEQISECITRQIIQDYSENLTSESLRYAINPNEIAELGSSSQPDLQTTLEYLLNQKNANKRSRIASERHTSNYLPQEELKHLLKTLADHARFVPKLNSWEFFSLMKWNSLRYDPARNGTSDEDENNRQAGRSINAACRPQVIELVKACLLERGNSPV